MASLQSDRRKSARPRDPQLRGRRAQPRAPIRLSATVDSLSGRRQTRLLEVSATGARLQGTDLPTVGREVILVCDSIDTFGKVVWAVSDRRGVQFDEPISTRQLIALRDASESVERSGVTPEELEAIADWTNGLAR
jgi:PilZ domain